MLYLLLILPTVMWALPPSPNAIDSLNPGVCGNQFACKPTSQCSVWYAEFPAFPPKPCADLRGVIGFCCPDVVNVRCESINSSSFN